MVRYETLHALVSVRGGGDAAEGSQDGVCAICQIAQLAEVQAQDQLARANPCGHRFCVDCIDGWTRHRSSSCPVCNASVTSLTRITCFGQAAPLSIPVAALENRRKDDSEQEPAVHEEPGATCAACGDFGFFVECDACKQNLHLHCAGLHWPPDGAFRCVACGGDAPGSLGEGV